MTNAETNRFLAWLGIGFVAVMLLKIIFDMPSTEAVSTVAVLWLLGKFINWR